MREKYFEDLGLDDGIDILDKFSINIDEILEESENHNNKQAQDSKKENKE